MEQPRGGLSSEKREISVRSYRPRFDERGPWITEVTVLVNEYREEKHSKHKNEYWSAVSRFDSRSTSMKVTKRRTKKRKRKQPVKI